MKLHVQHFYYTSLLSVCLLMSQHVPAMNWALSRLMGAILRLDNASVEIDTLDEHVTAARYEQFIVFS